MCNTAAHLVDRILPNVPVRQWVLSLPFELRALALARPEVVSALGRIFVEAVSRELRQSVDLPHAQCGAVSFLHRAGDSFNANPHWHAQQLDGVFFRDGPSGESGPIRFLPAPPPEPEQLERIATKIRQRSVRWLARRGFIDERAYEERSNERIEPTAIEACNAVSLRGGSFATIDDHGALAPGGTTTPIEPRRPGRFTVELGGFNINAAVRVAADDDVGRERLARYCARPSFALGRLRDLDDGRLAYQLRYPRRGKTHRVMTQLELMARLAAMVPPPRHPLVRYFGVLSSHAKLRSEVVPSPPEPEPDPLQLQTELPLCVEPDEPPRRKPWAWLLEHVFLHDVSVCPRCLGPTTWLEVATGPGAIDQAMVDHGLAPHRARPPPPPRLAPDGQLALPL